MLTVKIVFLIGPMGAGKTTIGRHLSDVLALPFIDTDHEIERRCGADIPWIFDVEGESGFRQREHRVLADTCAGGAAVVATGGGIVMREDNRQLLQQQGAVVYLSATVAQQLARTKKDRGRPLLNSADPKQVLSDLMTLRDPLYREVADITITSGKMRPRSQANEIADKIRALPQA